MCTISGKRTNFETCFTTIENGFGIMLSQKSSSDPTVETHSAPHPITIA